MASNYTGNYTLCQWEDTDQVKRTEFNEDNAKIDAALGSLASAVSGKASSSAVSSLQSSLNSLKTTVSQQRRDVPHVVGKRPAVVRPVLCAGAAQ